MNYIGSKYSLIDFIFSSITSVAGKDNNKVFADLFAGTGIVGKTFKQNGFKVISNDIQYYSYVLNRHLIGNTPPLSIENYTYLNDLPVVDNGFIYKNYCMGSGSKRNYFTDINGKKCDTIRVEIERLRQNGLISDDQYFWLLASLINSIDKYANTASVYGAFLKCTKKSASKDFMLEPIPLVNGNKDCKVYNEDVEKLINKISGDILYLDPPYNARQYCSNYHLLETIARYDSPNIHGKTGLRDNFLQKSKFCSVKTAAQSLESIIQNSDFKYIFLSYNNEGLIPVNLVREIMSKYGKYELFSTNYKRFKADKDSNRNFKSDTTIEYLHCLIK